jgi:hypothetical protein
MKMFRMLLWKEWREWRWRFLALLVMLAIPPAAGRLFPRSLDDAGGTTVLLALAAPIWAAAAAVTGERRGRTEGTLCAMPVAEWQPFAVKSLAGAAACLVPAAIALWWLQSMVARVTGLSILPIIMSAAYVYVWTLVAASGARREGMAAIVGVLMLLGQFFLTVPISSVKEPALLALSVITPMVLIEHRQGTIPAIVVAAQVAWCTGLWVLAVWFRTTMGLGATRAGVVKLASAVESNAPVRPQRRRMPLVWKEWREQRGMVMATLIAAVLLAAIIAMEEARWGFWRGIETTFVGLSIIALIAPSILAVALGISAFVEDLDEGIAGFWRSRPIDPTKLFQIKFATALFGILAMMMCLMAAGSLGIWLLELKRGSHITVPHPRDTTFARLFVGQVIWLPFVLMISACATVLLRRTIPAAAVSLTLIAVLATVPCPGMEDSTILSQLMNAPLDLPFVIVAIGVTVLTLAMGWFIRRRFRHGQGRMRIVME